MDSTPTSLNVIQIIVYAGLLFMGNYNLFHHGKRGILGWLYLVLFCTIRLVAAVIDMLEKKSGSGITVTLIVENIGLSPLMLAILGVLHEARYKCQAVTSSRNEWILVFIFHGAVTLSMVLLIVGMLKLTHPDSGSTSPETGNMRAGFIIMLGCFVNLTGWLAWSFFTVGAAPGVYRDINGNDNDHDNVGTGEGDNVRHGYILLYAVLFSLPMILIRGIYGAISLFSSIQLDPRDPYKPSKFSSNLAASVCMSVLPQFLVPMALAAAGVLIVRASRARKSVRAEAVPLTLVQNVGSERENAETVYESYGA